MSELTPGKDGTKGSYVSGKCFRQQDIIQGLGTGVTTVLSFKRNGNPYFFLFEEIVI